MAKRTDIFKNIGGGCMVSGGDWAKQAKKTGHPSCNDTFQSEDGRTIEVLSNPEEHFRMPDKITLGSLEAFEKRRQKRR